MSDDLATLLRDASNEPTITPDADAIHAAGQRRTVVRRTATGLGALALMGVVAAGVSSLLPETTIPPIDTAPSTEAPGNGDGVVDSALPTITAAGLAEASGSLVTVLQFDADARRFDRTDVTPDGTTSSSTFDVKVALNDPMIGDDGVAWILDGDSRTVSQAPDGPLEVRAETGGPSGWMPIGFTSQGEPLVSDISTGGVPVAGPPTLQVLTADGSLSDFPGVDASEVVSDFGYLAEAASRDERLVVLHGPAGDGAFLDVLYAGGGSSTLHMAQSEPSAVGSLALVGDEAWLAETAYATDGDLGLTGPIDLLLRDFVATSGSMRRLATPIGRGIDGNVTGIDVSPDGLTAVLSVRGYDGYQLPAVVVDVEAARSAARVGTDLDAGPQADDAVVDGVFKLLDVPGFAAISRWTAPDAALPAICAAEAVDRIDAVPSEDGLAVWFACHDAGQRSENAIAFWKQSLTAATDPLPEDAEARVRLAVERWAAGPTADERALGLTGGFGDDVSLTGVSFEGRRVLVDVTPAPGSEAAWSTSSESMFHATGLAAAALQLDDFDELLLTTNGRCEDFTLMTEVVPCWVYTRDDAPWAGAPQGATSVALDGRHPVGLVSIDAGDRLLGFDVVQWLTGEQANTAFRRDTDEQSSVPNDYWVTDDDHTTIVLAVADDVEVTLSRFGQLPEGEPGSWADLPDYLGESAPGEPLGNSIFWVEIRDGIVISIEEQWVP